MRKLVILSALALAASVGIANAQMGGGMNQSGGMMNQQGTQGGMMKKRSLTQGAGVFSTTTNTLAISSRPAQAPVRRRDGRPPLGRLCHAKPGGLG